MTFLEARDKLDSLYPNRYRSIHIEMTTKRSGECVVECGLYLDPRIMAHASTWEEAFDLLAAEVSKRDMDNQAVGA